MTEPSVGNYYMKYQGSDSMWSYLEIALHAKVITVTCVLAYIIQQWMILRSIKMENFYNLYSEGKRWRDPRKYYNFMGQLTIVRASRIMIEITRDGIFNSYHCCLHESLGC